MKWPTILVICVSLSAAAGCDMRSENGMLGAHMEDMELGAVGLSEEEGMGNGLRFTNIRSG